MQTIEPDFFRVFGSGWVLKTQTQNSKPNTRKIRVLNPEPDLKTRFLFFI
jgi:hypothetical protein